MNKKYLPSALIMYLNYFIHGVGCSILGQAVIKETLAAAWGVEAMAITAISAALGLGRLIALPFAGPLSDKLGRRISTAIGSASYAVYLIGLAFAFSAGQNGGYQIAYVCAIIGGISNSFLDTGCRDYQQCSGCRYHGNQIFHCDRADASAVRTRCCCDNHRHRHGILQSVIYRMRYYLRCFIYTYFPVPAARF